MAEQARHLFLDVEPLRGQRQFLCQTLWLDFNAEFGAACLQASQPLVTHLRVAHADLRDQGCDRITTPDDALTPPPAFALACRRKIIQSPRENDTPRRPHRREVGTT